MWDHSFSIMCPSVYPGQPITLSMHTHSVMNMDRRERNGQMSFHSVVDGTVQLSAVGLLE